MTETTPAVVDETTFAVTRSVLIRAHRSAVWEAITTPELIEEWLGQKASFDSLAVGARGVFGWDGYGDFPVEIVELDEPSVFAFRWGEVGGHTLTDENSTVARYTIEEVPEGTLLTVVETGFDRLAGDAASRRSRADENRKGWNEELDELVAFLEKQDSA